MPYIVLISTRAVPVVISDRLRPRPAGHSWFDASGTLIRFAAVSISRDDRALRIVAILEDMLMLLDDVKTVVASTLQMGSRVQQMDAAAPLLGAVPELDSIAVVNLITALEEHFGITVADDEIGASTFETLGSLAQFIERKLSR
jgi:acyl carrier protein